jgi:uncharacterized protein
MTVTGFEWDEGNRRKCRKHGISIGEIEAMFRQSLSVFPDPAHSHHESVLRPSARARKAAIF